MEGGPHLVEPVVGACSRPEPERGRQVGARGVFTAEGQFDIVSQTEEVAGDAWTDFLPESALLEADWEKLECGMYNTETGTCVQLTSNY